MKDLRIGISPITSKVYVGKMTEDETSWKGEKKDVTTDFKRCVVHFCTETVEFEVDGMKFRATCELIE